MYHGTYEVKLTYKPRNMSVTHIYQGHIYDEMEKPSKYTIIYALRQDAKLATIGQWREVVDNTGKWYINDTFRKGDVSTTKLAMWRKHTQLLRTLFGSRYDKFMAAT